MAQQHPTSSTVKTRILIISDTHNVHPATSDSEARRPFKQPLPKADVLLHCGDLTMQGLLHEYETTLDMLAGIDAELKLVIAGNHDISLDKEFYHGPSKSGTRSNGKRMHLKNYEEDMPGKAMDIWTGAAAKKAGVTYLQEGTHAFTLSNGAKFTVYASPYQPEFCNWAFPYERHEDRFNSREHSAPDAQNIATTPMPAQAGAVDIVMTHGPPLRRLDRTASGLDVGCPHLLRAVQRVRPRLHCWGHIHEAWGAERVTWPVDGGEDGESLRAESVPVVSEEVLQGRAARLDVSEGAERPLKVGEETVMVNASIMDLSYAPVNAPWLVEMDLPAV
ncbi:uncharacterized protein K452DRAFT_251073 [Aplosporella prunicola CBS 121167]|uniref:Calcineurin-like phosphoesterase domain-containing protein n=1 Tax=Aplosporella prunicola CBS 121167 TaxID=1176127 RepID=A0A6A6BFL0_9PEZI|nr:uncharacterized protein K452DRAFT_251073 [Aplosporella prunicola CBS 121167]KAF2141281.1 hypothetical protein K452DRAFT_251073 [Aplosporella prunicola CBS 121167]